MLEIFRAAAKVNRFELEISSDYRARRLNLTEQSQLIETLLNRSVRRGRRLVYTQHLYWINLSAVGISADEASRVTWINQMREPEGRLLSAFGWNRDACCPGHRHKPPTWCGDGVVARHLSLSICKGTALAEDAFGNSSDTYDHCLPCRYLCGAHVPEAAVSGASTCAAAAECGHDSLCTSPVPASEWESLLSTAFERVSNDDFAAVGVLSSARAAAADDGASGCF